MDPVGVAMNRNELIDRIKKYEWSDVEFKEARNQAPRSAYQTVSAFANTAGGWLVFGVRDNGGVFEIVGVLLRQELLSDEQQRFQAQLGVRLDDERARVLAFACRNGRISLTDTKAITGRTAPEAREVLSGLVVGNLLRPLDNGTQYGLAEHLQHRLDAAGRGSAASDPVTGKSAKHGY